MRCSAGSEADEGGELEALAELQRMVDDIKAQAQRDKARKRQAIIKARSYWLTCHAREVHSSETAPERDRD